VLCALVRRGKAGFKKEVTRHAQLEASALPFREAFVVWLREQQKLGRKVYLATGADESLAKSVAAHLGLDGVLASDGMTNLTGAAKLAAIQQHANGAPFTYAGNDHVDLPVWHGSTKVILVASGTQYASLFMQENIEATFPDKVNQVGAIVRLLRPHQWAKNILVFLPALAAHMAGNVAVMTECAWLFAAFSLCASGVYVANDMLDVGSDRQHAHKRRRPLASGAVTLPIAVALAVVLPVAALAVAKIIGWGAVLMVAAYWIISSLYSFRAKRVPILDVFILAGLYAFRALAGALAVPTGISSWMGAFLLFLFLSLACAKRFSELLGLPADHAGVVVGRGYQRTDSALMAMLGVSAAFGATIVVCLYAGSPAVVSLYPHASYLLGVGPLVLFGLSRFWLMAWRGELHSDPVLHALRDPISYLLVAAAFGFAFLATLG
jgi:4-hydroxybenzoate polyprenyltransferase